MAKLAREHWEAGMEPRAKCYDWFKTCEDLGEDLETSEVLHRRRHLGHLWALQLSESLSWSILKSRYISRGHINVQEVKAHKDLIRHIDRDRRIVVLQDSRVCLGCSSKGRSGSKALNIHQRSEAAYLLGKTFMSVGRTALLGASVQMTHLV